LNSGWVHPITQFGMASARTPDDILRYVHDVGPADPINSY
jgi:hypothetical protein